MEGFINNVTSLGLGLKKSKGHICPSITTSFFRLHYPLTVIILSSMALFGTFSMSGSPISCSVDPIIDNNLMNTYCWIQSTYTLPDHFNRPRGVEEWIRPGVGHKQSSNEEEKYHTYYQWVVFVLVFQALLFYVPYHIWEQFENGRLQMLLLPSEPTLNKKELDFKVIIRYLAKEKQTKYCYSFIFCEALNFLNVLFQIYFVNFFLGYEFTTYGAEVLRFLDMDPSNRTDPMDRVFPKLTKCTFNKYGPSGNIINYDGLCVLSLNIYHEKIYIFLWFWFILLAVLSGGAVVWSLIKIMSLNVRLIILRKKTDNFSTKNRGIQDLKYGATRVINDRISPGGFFMLEQLRRNMWPHNYKKLIKELAIEYGWKEPKKE